MTDKTTTTFETYQNTRHGYTMTYIVIRTMYEENTRAKRDGTVDNKDGYGTMEAARRMGAKFQELLNRGYETHYDQATYSGVRIHLEWQHYQHEDGTHSYCDPSFGDLGRRFECILRGIKFLKKLGGNIERRRARESATDDYLPAARSVCSYTFETPERVLEALRSMRGLVEIERLKDLDCWVAVDRARQSRAA